MKTLAVFTILMLGIAWSDEFLQELVKRLDERGRKAWWWDEEWWRDGYIPSVPNHRVEVSSVTLRSGDVELPVLVFRPKGGDRYPGVLFLHGRRGLDDLTQLHARRLAARGFVVVAPDLYTPRLIEQFPSRHDPVTEEDAEKALDYLISRDDVYPKKVCVYGISRGGFYALRLLVHKGRQNRDIACFVGYYPHLQDPQQT